MLHVNKERENEKESVQNEGRNLLQQLHVLKADSPRMGSREAVGVMNAHRLQQSNSKEPSRLSGVFYDDQDFIMHNGYLQDENTPRGPFDHDIEHVKIRPLYRHRQPKDKSNSQIDSIDEKVKSLDATHAEREKESLQFRERHQRGSVLAKYSERRDAQKDNGRKRDSRLSLPARLNSKTIRDIRMRGSNVKEETVERSGVRRKIRRTEEFVKEEAENIDIINRRKSLPVKIDENPTQDEPDTRLKENVQRHQLRNFVRKLVSPYKSDRPNKTKQINGLVPNSNLIVSDAMKLKVQSKLRRSSRRHALPNGFHKNAELLRLRGGPLGESDMSILMHTPPERNAAKKAMAQMSPVRDKVKERLFASSEKGSGDGDFTDIPKIAIKQGQQNVEPRGTRLKFDSDQDSVGSSKGGHRSSRDTSPETDVGTRRRSRRSHVIKGQIERIKKVYESDDQSSVIDIDSDSDFVLSDHTSEKSELSIRLTRSRKSENDLTSSENGKISTRSSGLSDHWSKVASGNSSS